VLLEPLRYNWCRIPQAWDSTGKLLGSEQVQLLAQVRLQEKCTDKLSREVEYGGVNQPQSITNHVDSVVVVSVVNRLDTSFREEYVLRRGRGGTWVVDVYRITMVVSNS
jgi:hypothetical protein